MASNNVTQPRTIVAKDGTDFRGGYNGSGSDISTGYILKHDGTNTDGVELATAATDSIAGVSTETIENGKTRSYQRDGKTWVYAGETLTPGQKVTADATSRAVAISAASAANFENVLGTVVTAGDAGDKVEVELEIGGKAYVAASTVADRAALKAIAAANRFEGQEVVVQSDYSRWVFDADGTQAEDTADELVQQPSAGSGRWLRNDKAFIMKVPLSFANSDGDALETIPAGFCLRLTGQPYWEVTTAFTGGTSSAIGISTNITGYEAGGDILGGASGDVEATLTAGDKPGTIGDELGDQVGFHALLLEENSEIQFDAITSAFTAGAGFVCLPVVQCQT